MAAALPLIDLVYRRGHFQFSDSQETALYFFWFALSLCFWSAQGLYSRAFYAAGNTLVPMVASSLITLASIPIYSVLFHKLSSVGLAMASDIGIVANTLALALLLHQRRSIRVNELNWGEIAKAGVTSLVAGLLAYVRIGRVLLAIGNVIFFFFVVFDNLVLLSAWLLAVHVLTGLDLLDGHLRVPVVGRGPRARSRATYRGRVRGSRRSSPRTPGTLAGASPSWCLPDDASRPRRAQGERQLSHLHTGARLVDDLQAAALRTADADDTHHETIVGGRLLGRTRLLGGQSWPGVQVGSPAAARVPSDRWRKPRRDG